MEKALSEQRHHKGHRAGKRTEFERLLFAGYRKQTSRPVPHRIRGEKNV
jgi:hypothetical protein